VPFSSPLQGWGCRGLTHPGLTPWAIIWHPDRVGVQSFSSPTPLVISISLPPRARTRSPAPVTGQKAPI
jgi:hypothetical protein